MSLFEKANYVLMHNFKSENISSHHKVTIELLDALKTLGFKFLIPSHGNLASDLL